VKQIKELKTADTALSEVANSYAVKSIKCHKSTAVIKNFVQSSSSNEKARSLSQLQLAFYFILEFIRCYCCLSLFTVA